MEILLHLYVSGTTERSARAIQNIRRFCEEHYKGRYSLKVMNVTDHPELAADEQLVALPTLVKKRPVPPQRFIGDLSDADRLAASLPEKDPAP
jgi:circadian clock protein KaiB